jgi:hypothetical protein
MKIVGKLKAVLGLDDKQYQKGLDKNKKKTNKFASTLKKIGGLVAGAFAVNAVKNYITKTTQAVAETQRYADRLGIGVEAMQELNYAAEQFGVGADAMRDGLKELTMRVDEFAQTGKGPASEVMKNLGITRGEAEQLKGNTEELFNVMVDKISQVQNTAERQRIADELFGGQGGEQLVEMVASGTAELEKFRKEAQKIGYVVPKGEAKRMEKLDQSMKQFGARIKGAGRSLVNSLAPAIQKTLDYVGDFVVKMGNAAKSIERVKKEARDNVTQQAIREDQKEVKALAKRYRELEIASDKRTSKIKAAKDIMDQYQGVLESLNEGEAQRRDQVLSQINALSSYVSELETTKKAAKESGEDTGGEFADGVIEGFKYHYELRKGELKKVFDQTRGINVPGKAQGIGMGPFSTENTTAQLQNMDRILAKNKEMQESLRQTGNESRALSGVTRGLQQVFMNTFENTENALSNFFKFFTDWITNMIARIASMIAAVTILAALLSLTGLGGVLGMGSNFGGVLKALTGGGLGKMIGGFVGMANGGVVPSGYPNDTYPALLSSGETVTPPNKLPVGKGGYIAETRISGDDLRILLREADRKHNNTL